MEQRWPVTLIPRAWAASMAAPSTSRVMRLYALNDVTPRSAQKFTWSRASWGVASWGKERMKPPGPSR